MFAMIILYAHEQLDSVNSLLKYVLNPYYNTIYILYNTMTF